MCFYNDYDWRAEVCEKSERSSEEDCHCDECHQAIPAGVRHTYIYMAQHETPRDWNDEGLEYGEDLPEDDPSRFDPGEEFDYRCCSRCWKVLEAIEAAELEEGCPKHAARPALTRLHSVMWVDANREGGRYRAKAMAMFPELKEHLEVICG